MRTDVHRVLDVLYAGDPVKARVLYSRERPLELLVQIYTPFGPATWLVSRDLLRDGLDRPAGDGSVHICPDPTTGTTTVQLSRDPDAGGLAMRTSDLADLLNATTLAVPYGAESHDWDTALAQLAPENNLATFGKGKAG